MRGKCAITTIINDIKRQMKETGDEDIDSANQKTEDFTFRIEPDIREEREGVSGVVERRELRDDEEECKLKMKPEMIQNILSQINKIQPFLVDKQLSLTKISFQSCVIPLSGDTIEQLSKFIHSVSSIDSFTLRFIWCGYKLPPRFILSLQRVSNQLRELYLHFALTPEMAEQCIDNLTKAIDSCRILELLHLDGMECEGITNNCLSKMGRMTLKLQSLRSFEFKLRQQTYNNGGISIKSAQKYTLQILNQKGNNFFFLAPERSQYIDQTGIQEFGRELSKLSRLTHLEMSFYYFMNAFSKASMSALSSAFVASYWLESLILDFSWCLDIEDEAAEIVVKSIQNLHHLKELTLNFSGSSRLSNSILALLGETLVKVDSLQKLTLELANCEQLSDDGVITFSRCLAKCSNIHSFSIDIQSCFNITDNAVENICQAILQLPYLNDLNLQMHEFLSRDAQNLVDEMTQNIKERELSQRGAKLALYMTCRHSHFLKRKEYLSDIIY